MLEQLDKIPENLLEFLEERKANLESIKKDLEKECKLLHQTYQNFTPYKNTQQVVNAKNKAFSSLYYTIGAINELKKIK